MVCGKDLDSHCKASLIKRCSFLLMFGFIVFLFAAFSSLILAQGTCSGWPSGSTCNFNNNCADGYTPSYGSYPTCSCTCEPACTDECTLGATFCSVDTVVYCTGAGDSDPCTEWVTGDNCDDSDSYSCQDSDTVMFKDYSCVGGSCIASTSYTDCGSNQHCDAGSCVCDSGYSDCDGDGSCECNTGDASKRCYENACCTADCPYGAACGTSDGCGRECFGYCEHSEATCTEDEQVSGYFSCKCDSGLYCGIELDDTKECGSSWQVQLYSDCTEKVLSPTCSVDCPDGETCISNICYSCTHECSEGDERCSGEIPQECGEAGDGDPCREWVSSSGSPCPTGSTEDDDGLNYDTKGTCYDYTGCQVIGGVAQCTGGGNTDVCSDNTLTEYYKSGDSCDSATYTCPSGASDSGDSGNDHYDGGSCIDYEGCSDGACHRTTYTESCGSGNVLTEYWDSGSSCSSEDYDCDNDDVSASDNDGGDSPGTKGTCSAGANWYCSSAECVSSSGSGGGTDSCSINTLTEYYPSGFDCLTKSYSCSDFEVLATGDTADDPTTTSSCSGGTGASCSDGEFSTYSGASGSDTCEGTCGTGTNSCEFREYYAVDSTDTCSGKDSCTSKTYDADTNRNTCETCGQVWSIGGEVDPNECCGDDSGEHVSERVGDPSTLESDISSSTDEACCSASTDCVYNDACYTASTGPGVNVDGDADPDYCGSTGTWWDCNDLDISGVFECDTDDHYVCEVHDCVRDCFEKPCLDGQPTCYDYYKDQTLYCVNTTDDSDKSSYVENPAGGNSNERYCYEGQFYRPGFGCTDKGGSDICYNLLDPTPLCGTLNLPSMLDCGYPAKYFCDSDSGNEELITIIESDNTPNKKVNKGPSAESNFILDGCIDTDGGIDVKNWGCTYVMHASSYDESEELNGYIACDQVYSTSVTSYMVEHFCSNGDISARAYSCSIQGEDSETPHCWETSTSYESQNPILESTPNMDSRMDY